MIVCDRFVFVHLHKSGGTFVNQLMLNCMPGAARIGYHLPYRELPPEYRHLPVVGTVRNPWDYYVSWYFFQRGQPRPNALFAICSENNSLGFGETVENLLMLHDDPPRVSRLKALLPDRYLAAGLNLTKACVADLAGSGLGFYSFLYRRMYAGAQAPHVIPMSSLREALRTVFDRLDIALPPLAEIFLEQAPRMNTSAHDDYRSYYTPGLWRRVEENEAYVIARHGHDAGRADGGPARLPVTDAC